MINKQKEQELLAQVTPLHAYINNVEFHIKAPAGLDENAQSVVFPNDTNRDRVLGNLNQLAKNVAELITKFGKKPQPSIVWNHDADTLREAMGMDEETFHAYSSDMECKSDISKALMLMRLADFYSTFTSFAMKCSARLHEDDSDVNKEALRVWILILESFVENDSKSQVMKYILENIKTFWPAIYNCKWFPISVAIETFQGRND